MPRISSTPAGCPQPFHKKPALRWQRVLSDRGQRHLVGALTVTTLSSAAP
jgi:hypothetical protein